MPQQYIDMTPSWSAILPIWQRAVGNVTSCSCNQRDRHNKVMGSFWEQMEQMAAAADRWNEYCQAQEIAAGAAEQEDAPRITTFGDSMEQDASHA